MQTLPIARPSATVAANARTASLVAFLIGATMVFIVGFAHPQVLHNAAHDTRHALAFPCH